MGHTIFLLIALAATCFAGPIQEVVVRDQCARQCTVSSQFNYEPGKSYEFTYETELRTSIQGASEDHAGVHLAATVHLDFLSKCEMVMRLSDVKLSEHDPATSTMTPVTSDLILSLESNPLTVSFQDGRIEELCLSSPENEKVLNIKRGILSLIQNNADDINKDQTVTEMDVSGECETEYSSSDKGWYNKLIKKSKNLLGCKGRQSSNTAIQGIPYMSDSDFQSLPLIKSTHACEQEIAKATGRLQSATCREQHTFAPFSRQGSGATTHNTQTLTFVKEQKSRAKPEMIALRTPLTFQRSTASSDATRKDMEKQLMEICASTMDGVTPETPTLFSTLVYTMKSMTADDLVTVLQKIQKKEICSTNNERVRKFFLDAIPMTGTVDSLRLMSQLLTSGQVSGMEADMWMTTLSFIQNPTLDMISEVKPLLSMKTNEEKAMLSVSSLVHSVCKNNPRCDNYLEVRKIISLLENKIAPSCKITEDTFQTSLMALRAIGNAGFGTSAIPTLVKCLRAENPVDIRLSAIEAFRRIPCKADTSSVLSVFTDKEEDSEIRIAAYRSLMMCPTDELLNSVKKTLQQEEVNQVGSYVWSHLTNLMETSDPHKQGIRSILEDEALLKEFDMDKRKFSRNYEKSIFIEKLNTGATAEGDLIWSSKSFIPRSAMVNLTVDLFGNAINLFEIGGRVEGLEYFLESYFGPNGYFSDKNVNDVFEETAIDVVRAEKVKRIDKRISRGMDELRASLYMKVFGNELRYMNFQGLDSLVSGNNFNLLDMLVNLNKDNDFQYTHSAMFLDSSVIVPTSSGIPLNLTCNGTVTVDMKASGKMDVLKMTSSPATLEINGVVRPSAALVVSSVMGIDALDTQVGIKMVQTLHSKTSVQGKISLAEGSILNVEFDLPDDKQDIFSISSAFFTVHRHAEREQKMITKNRQEFSVCSGSKIAKITGLELCGELSYSNASMVENAPYFPMTGPVKAGIILYKRDNKMSGYKLEARSTHNTDENIIRFAFSTPNSDIDRTFGFDLNLNKAQGSFDASFSSPWKKADFKGTFVNERLNRGLSGRLNWDGSVHFDLKASLQAENSGPGMMYTPTVQFTGPGMDTVGLAGVVKYAPWKLFETDLTINGLFSSPILVKSSLENKAKIMSASASLSLSPKKVYGVDMSVQTTQYKKKVIYKPQITVTSPQQELLAFGGSFTNVYGKNLELDVVLDKIVEQPIILKTNLISKSFKRGREQKIVRIDLRSDLVDIKMRNKFDNRNWNTLATDIDLTYVIRRFARDKVKLVTKLINLSSKSLTKGRASLNFASNRYPDYNLKLISNVNHNQRHSELDADIAYGTDFKAPERQISLSMAVERALKSWTDARASVNGKLLIGNDFRIVTKVDHLQQPKSLDSTVMIRVNKDALESSLTIKDQSDKLRNYFGQFKLDVSGKSFDISQSINERSPNDFISTLDARMGKYKNTIVTSWNKSADSALKLSFDINLHSLDQILVDGEYEFGPELYKAAGSFQKASQKYSAIATAQASEGNSVQIATELSCPTRRVVGNVEASKTGNKYSSRADVRWNADRDDTQRITLISNGQVSGQSNVEGSITIQYPQRTISLNLKNNVESKYATHIDVKWEPTKVISFDSVFGAYEKPDGLDIIGSLKMETPYESLQSLDLNLNHKVSNDQHQTSFDMEWHPQQSLTGTITIKKPINLRNINVNVIAKAPSLGYKTIESQLTHNINNGMISMGRLTWNKQSIQVDVAVTNKSNELTTDYKGQVDIKTTFRSLKTAAVTVAYSNDGRKTDTVALVDYNKKQLGFQSTVRSRFNGWNMNTNADITLSLPTGDMKMTWNHQSSVSLISSKSEITWDNNRIFVNFNGLQNLSLSSGSLSAALEIQTPLMALRDVVFQLKHLHKDGTVDSTLSVSNNGNKLVSLEGKYLRENGKITSQFTATNPLYDGTISALLSADYRSNPMTGRIEMALTPVQTVTVEGSYGQSYGDIDAILTVAVPKKPTLTIAVKKVVEEPAVRSELSIQYDSGKVIRLESVHQTEPSKQIKLKFSSPFTQVYSAEGYLQMSNEGLTGSASIEAEPFLRRWKLSSAFENVNGLSANVKIETPYPEVAYSQVTLSSEMVDGSRQSSIIVEYQPSKIIKLSNILDIKSLTNLSLSADLSTPFESIRYISAALRHSGSLTDFSNNGEIEYPRGQKFVAESQFSLRNGMQTSIKLRSPLTEDMSMSMSLNGNLRSFTSHGDFTWGETVSVDLTHEGTLQKFSSSVSLIKKGVSYGGNMMFNLEPKVSMEIELSLPVQSFEKVRISHSFDGKPMLFETSNEISTSGFGTVSSVISVDMETRVFLEATLQTPLKGFKDLKLSFTHEGTLARFASHAEYKNGLSSYSGDIRLNTDPAINLEALVRTPYSSAKVVRLSFTLDGKVDNFKLNTEAQLNKDTSALELVSNTQKKWNIDLTVRSPFIDTIKGSFDHWGSWKKFQSKLLLRSGKDKLLSNIKFALNPTFNAMFTIKSPFSALKNHQIQLKHAGSNNNFKCNMQYKCNGNTYVGDASFQNEKAIKAEMNLKGPTFRPISVAVSHDGQISNFKSSAIMSMGKKAIQLTGDFNADNGVKGSLRLKTPFDGYENLGASISHFGDFDFFKTEGDLTFSRQTGKFQIAVDTTKDISAKVTISPPVQGYNDIIASVLHTGSLNNFNTITQFSVGKQSVEGKVSFQTSPITGSALLRSTFPNINNYGLSFRHEGTFGKFETHGEFNHGEKKSTADLSFDSTNGYEGRLNIETPLFKKTDIQMKHSSSDNTMSTTAFFAQDDEHLYSIRSDLSKAPLSGLVSVKTPFNGLELTELSVHHDGSINNFRTDADLQLFGEKYDVEISFSSQPKVDGSLRISTPLTDEIEASFQYEGKPTRFDSRFNVLYEKVEKLRVEASLNMEGPYSGDLKIISPLMKNLKTSFSHAGGIGDFSTEAQVTYAGQKSEASITLKTQPDIDATFRIVSPFIKDTEINFSHSGSLTDCHTDGTVTYGGQPQLTVKGQFSYLNSLNGEYLLTSAIPGMSLFSTKIRHDASASGFTCHGEMTLEDKSVSGDIRFSPTMGSVLLSTPSFTYIDGSYTFGRTSGSIKLSAPFMEDIKGEYVIKDTVLNSVSRADLSYGNTQIFTASGDMKYPVSGDISIETPVSGFENSRLTWMRRGDYGGDAAVYIGGTKHEGSAVLSLGRQIAATASIGSPAIPRISSSFEFSGNVNDFKTHAGIVFKSEEHIFDAELSTRNDIKGKVVIKSPFLSETSATFSSTKDMNNLDAAASIVYENTKLLDIHTTTENALRKAASLSVTVPDNALFIASSFEGSLSDFTAHLETDINGKKTEADVTFALTPLRSEITVKTTSNEVQLTLSYDGSVKNFNAKSSIRMNSEIIDAEIMFNIETAIEGRVKLSTPGSSSPMIAAFDVSGMRTNFRGHSEFSLGNGISSADVSFTMHPLRATVGVKTPISVVDVNAAFEGSLTNFKTQVGFKLDDKQLDIDAQFNIDTAIEGSAKVNIAGLKTYTASFEHSKSAGNIKSLFTLEQDGDSFLSFEMNVSKNPMKTSVSIRTPFAGYKTISVLFSHDGEMTNFKNHAEISIEGQATKGDLFFNIGSKMESRVSLESPFIQPVSTGFEFSGNERRFSLISDYSYGKNKYSLTTTVDTSSGIDISTTASTPIEGYRMVSGKLAHKGLLPDFESLLQIKTGRRNLLTGSAKVDSTNGFSAKMSLQSVFTPTLQASLEHSGKIDNFNTNAEIRYNGQSSSATVAFKSAPTVSGLFSFTSPYTYPLSGAFDIVSTVDKTTLHAEGKLNLDSIVSDMSVEYGETLGATVAFSTPFDGYEKMNGAAKYVRYEKGFTVSVEAECQDQKIEYEARANWRNDMSGSLSLKTPFTETANFNADFSLEGSLPNIRTQLNFMHNAEKYSLNGDIQNNKGKITISTPISGYEDLSAEISKEGSIENQRAIAKITYMTGQELMVSFENKIVTDRLETKATISTPYTEDLTFDLTLTGKLTDFSSIVSVAMGHDNSATSSTTFKLGDASLEFDTSLQTILTGYADEQKLSFSYEGILPNVRVSGNAKVLGSYVKTELSLQVDDKITGAFTLQTPVNSLKDIALNFEHSGDFRRFSTKTEIQYETNKKIDGSIQYVKYGWRRLQTSLEIRTPFSGYEMSKASYRHTASVDSFECDADLSFMNKDFNGNLRASTSPVSASVSLTTPFNGFEQVSADAKYEIGTGFFNAEANVLYMQGHTLSMSTDVNINASPRVASLKLTTPFKGYETSDIILTYSGDLSNFQSSASLTSSFVPTMRSQANLRYSSPKNLEGSVTFESQIPSYENLRFGLKNEGIRGKYDSKIEASWAPAKSVLLRGTFIDNKYTMSSDLTMTTPFEVARQLIFKTETELRGTLYTQKSVLQYNGKTIGDVEGTLDLAERKTASILVRAPVTGIVSMEGSMVGKYEGALSMSQDITDMDKGLKASGEFDQLSKQLSIKYKGPVKTVSFDGTFNTMKPNFKLYIDGLRYGYDMERTTSGGNMKVMIPSRTIMVSGSSLSGTTEGSFMWDADRDESQKVGFRSVVVPSKDSTSVDLTVMLPSLGKEVQIDSQMSLNHGRIIFDGKTELTYSRDSRKKFTVMSRLEDISSGWSSKNYSLSFGISHPYTSVDVQVASQFGNSDQKWTGGINMKYLTVSREIKTFSVNGQIDKTKKTFSLDMNTPMKKIGIDGNAQTDSPYRLALRNRYDDKLPLNTILAFDPSRRSVDFQINYDLENPNNEFHLSAKYVNSSAIAAEMFHVVNRQRTTDALMTLRLNTSSLLHSRLHWRPDMMDDLKALTDRKTTGYRRRLRNFASIASTSMQSELRGKTQLIGRSLSEEAEPLVEQLRNMYDKNEYHLRDITDAVLSAVDDAKLRLEEFSDMTEQYISAAKTGLEDRLSSYIESHKDNILEMIFSLDETREYITLKTAELYNKYADHAYNISKPALVSVSNKYNKYVEYMNQLSSTHLTNTADFANDAIYGAREYINSGLASLMARDDVKFAKSVSGRVYQQGYNAYKAWEIQENTEMVANIVADWIRKEIRKELAEIESTVVNIMRSKMTVYDPQHGEIQMEFHLPIPLKSLDVIPTVDLTPYITKAKKYMPTVPSISLPSSDVRTWLPPYDAIATIEGNRVTTFDGISYDLDSSCTFILARDFVDSNFSLVLHKEDNNKTFITSAQGQAVKIFADGQVTLNELPANLPVVAKGISISSIDGLIHVNVADHVTVDYNKDTDRYIIKLNGYYFGKVSGLLGSYDNEPTNDMMTSFGKPADTADRLARTWEIGFDRCR